MAISLTSAELDAWLSEQADNTISTPYPLNITDVTAINASEVKRILNIYITKYVDLRATTVQLYNNTGRDVDFSGVKSLVYPPIMADGNIPSFSGCSSLLEVTNYKVSNLQSGCFSNCTNLTNVSLISDNELDCSYLFSSDKKLQSVKISASSLGDCTSMFSGCTILNIIDIPNKVTGSIMSMFSYCKALLEVNINAVNAKSLQKFCENCSSLKQVTLKAPLATSALNTFAYTYNLEKVTWEVPSLTSMESTFENSGIINTPELPSTLQVMKRTFYCCDSLKTFSEIPASVTSITKAFYGCCNLQGTLTLTDPLFSELELDTTDLNSSLSVVLKLTDSSTEFSLKGNMEKLSITTDNTVTIQNAIKNCICQKFYLESSISQSDWDEIITSTNGNKFKKYIYDWELQTPNVTDFSDLKPAYWQWENVSFCFKSSFAITCDNLLNTTTFWHKSVILDIPNCTSLKSALSCANIQDVIVNCAENVDCTEVLKGSAIKVMPDFVNKAGSLKEAFCMCSNLTEVSLKGDYINDLTDAFTSSGIKKITVESEHEIENITIPSYAEQITLNTPNLKNISFISTSDSRLLKSVVLKSNLITSLYNSFRECENLEKVILNCPNVTDYSYIFSGCSALKNIPYINYDKAINLCSAFNNCTSLTETVFIESDSITNVNDMFYGCTGLESVTIKGKNISRYDGVVTGCSNLKYFEFYSGVVPDSNSTYLIDTIPETLEEIKIHVTDGILTEKLESENLKKITYTDDETVALTIKSLKAKEIELNAAKITSLAVGTSVTSLNCSYLEKVTLNTPLVTDMLGTFAGCYKLKTFSGFPEKLENMQQCFDMYQNSGVLSEINEKIPDTVTGMQLAFHNQKNLPYILNIPKNVTDLANCFSGCSSLKTIYMWEIPVDNMANVLMTGCFTDCTSLADIYTAKEVTDNNWVLYNLSFNSDTKICSYKIYNRDKTLKAEGTVEYDPSVDYLELKGNTDEFVVTDSDVITPAIIQKLLEYKYPFATTSETPLDPSDNNFIFWAADPDKVHSNITDKIANMLTGTLDTSTSTLTITIN